MQCEHSIASIHLIKKNVHCCVVASRTCERALKKTIKIYSVLIFPLVACLHRSTHRCLCDRTLSLNMGLKFTAIKRHVLGRGNAPLKKVDKSKQVTLFCGKSKLSHITRKCFFEDFRPGKIQTSLLGYKS